MSAPERRPHSRWAPWWAYVVPIVVLNWVRQVIVSPSEVGDAVNVALFAVVTVLVAAVVTLLHRARVFET